MNEVNCPYCKEEIEIVHDDGYGYEEDERHTQECPKCLKVFTYFTSAIYYHEVSQAPCLNDGKHIYQKRRGAPDYYFVNKFSCIYCDDEKTILPEELKNYEIKEST